MDRYILSFSKVHMFNKQIEIVYRIIIIVYSITIFEMNFSSEQSPEAKLKLGKVLRPLKPFVRPVVNAVIGTLPGGPAVLAVAAALGK